MAHESAQAPELMASVIIPVYNKEDYLEACFASLLEQTISRDALEVIFIDDGSSDGSLGILGDFAAGHPWQGLSPRRTAVCLRPATRA